MPSQVTNAIDNRPSPATSGEESPATAEVILRVNDGLYADLAAEAVQMRARVGPATLPTGDNVAAFLFWEARLLDGARYRDWLKLLTDDCIYWVPSSRDNTEARSQISINFDDRRRLMDRIVLTETNALHAQIPPSRTCRLISNIEAWASQAEGIEVRSNIAIFEHRRGQAQRFVGWQEHHLVPSGERWLIRKKVINLINCDEPQGSVAFIL